MRRDMHLWDVPELFRFARLLLPPVAAALVQAGCGGGAAPSAPGEGDLLTVVNPAAVAIGMGVDAEGDVDVITVGGSPDAIAIERVTGTTMTQVDTSMVDFSDFLQNGIVELGLDGSALVADHAAYFVGLLGVTVVPLDGSAALHFARTGPMGPTGAVAAVDGGDVYLCYVDQTPTFGRFGADGTWEALFSAAPGEDCYAQAIAVDGDAVYFPTKGSIYRWSKSDGKVTTVVAQRDPSHAFVDDLAVSGDWLVAYDGNAVWKVAKTGTTTFADSTTLFTLAPDDPFVFSMTADATDVYLLSQVHLLRVGTTDGTSKMVAGRPDPPGSFSKLAVGASSVYFLNEEPGEGGSYSCELRSVPE